MRRLDRNGKMISVANVIPDSTIPVRTLTTRTELGRFELRGRKILAVMDCLSFFLNIRRKNARKRAERLRQLRNQEL